ncbi:polysaccharide deacetylase [Alphaproteobacteria bacterium GH1-50]|uniref:Polysaccharide deacetylase n=1 Tax=Kangsaoukella pontilimi TaxID=2691042 RepID=A0A7C9IIU4_9RHOB|nr:polysaccharide deacetylase family protein [Kangsaoukella pontilimi]MXQ09569.1 polysaccharide deacetylase [Kangsaoukella pontilimi]
MPTLPGDRIEFSAIEDRPPLKFDGDTKLVVWPILNLEVWEIIRPMARQVLPAPTGVSVQPDIPNWSWHEYGMRVGYWRLKKMFDARSIKPTLSINAAVCERYERVAASARDSGWEFMAHSYVQMPTHALDDEEENLIKTMDICEKFTGKRSIGWLGPGLTETYDTPDLLTKHGIKYCGDFVYDDEPTTMTTANGPLVTLPYTVELNDIPTMIVQHHESSYFKTKIIDQFDQLYSESGERAKFLSFAIHPYISGAPHRTKYLTEAIDYMAAQPGVEFWDGEQIYNWYAKQTGLE